MVNLEHTKELSEDKDMSDEQTKETINKIGNLSPTDTRNLVDAFAWLIQEDKKQNPELYKLKK